LRVSCRGLARSVTGWASGWRTGIWSSWPGRCRPNTLRAVAFDLKAFFTVTGKEPVEITAADVFEFLAHQRGDRTVVRLADRESGLSARTIARRLSSVSGFYAYLVARGDTPVQVNPVPRGLLTRRQGGSNRSRTGCSWC
jgi:site-specific recombinase XerC